MQVIQVVLVKALLKGHAEDATRRPIIAGEDVETQGFRAPNETMIRSDNRSGATWAQLGPDVALRH